MGKKILVIDDEELVTKSLLRLLKNGGYDAVVAQNGAEAVEKIKDEDFDLIISDVRMPGLDGIEVIQNIRVFLKKAGKKTIPEILITGYADMEKYKRAADLKVTDYIYKPFDNSDFLGAVKKAIG